MDATTTSKRKPTATDNTGDVSSPAAVDEVSDAEVEEFYAILRRMRDASRRLCGVAGARPPARAPAWRPSFSWEDFAPAPPAAPAPAGTNDDEHGPSLDHQDDTAAPPRTGIDLNVEPEPDTPSSASAPAPPATSRSARAQA